MIGALFEPGRNCQRLARADRVSVLIDGEQYFTAFKRACEQAHSSILIAGWDLDYFTPLHPGILGPFLHALTRERPALRVYLLTWDYSALYARERGLWSSRTRPWRGPRVTLALDDAHPFSGSQHQKLVIVDDALAFCGGFDLSQARWDTQAHAPNTRYLDDGRPYGPFHDVQLMVSGEAARHLGTIARERWLRATGKRLQLPGGGARWPESVHVDYTDVDVAIARTVPAFDGEHEVREVRQLYLDSIASAQRFIYIENQYLTAACLRDALVASLSKPVGPDICIVGPAEPSGWLEQATMGVLRARMIQRLRQADVHGRLKLYAPMVGDEPINVHSKLMIVDDTLLRVGSANLSNRSMGLDSECDMALRCDAKKIRVRLLSEHLGATIDGELPLFAAIAQCQGNARHLRELPDPEPSLLAEAMPEAIFFDNETPIEATRAIDALLRDESADRRPFMLATGLLILAALLAAAWRYTPLRDLLTPDNIAGGVAWLRAQPLAPMLLVAAFAGASLVLVPLTLLIVQSGMLLGAGYGILVSLIGAFVGISLGFAVGRVANKRLLLRVAGQNWRRLEKIFRKNAVLSVALVRLFPIAPFTVVNIVGGASPCSYFAFVAGSLLGITPGIVALSFFGRGLFELLTAPSWRDAIMVACAVLFVFGSGLLLRGRLHR